MPRIYFELASLCILLCLVGGITSKQTNLQERAETIWSIRIDEQKLADSDGDSVFKGTLITKDKEQKLFGITTGEGQVFVAIPNRDGIYTQGQLAEKSILKLRLAYVSEHLKNKNNTVFLSHETPEGRKTTRILKEDTGKEVIEAEQPKEDRKKQTTGDKQP